VVQAKFLAKLGNLPVLYKCRAEENKQAENWVSTWSWSDSRVQLNRIWRRQHLGNDFGKLAAALNVNCMQEAECNFSKKHAKMTKFGQYEQFFVLARNFK